MSYEHEEEVMRCVVPNEEYNTAQWQAIRPGQKASIEQGPTTSQALVSVPAINIEGAIRGYPDDWETVWQAPKDHPKNPPYGAPPSPRD